MAEEKKDSKPKDAPPPSAPSSPDPFTEIISIIALFMLGMYILNGLTSSVVSSGLFSSGFSGFTEKGILLRHSRPLSSLENPILATVVSLNPTSVYDSPAGEEIGEQKVSAEGVVIQGPVLIESTRYWDVDYQKDPDGWVKEDDIAYLESRPTLVEKIVLGISGLVTYFKILVVLISIVSVIFIIYLFREIMELRRNEDKLLYPEIEKKLGYRNRHWERIIDHIESKNENDWRLAILEADIMLSGLLDALSLPGETIGEKLKSVEKSDFTTLDNAWEAHEIRNSIAHEGVIYTLGQREARRVIELYRTVFEEFKMI